MNLQIISVRIRKWNGFLLKGANSVTTILYLITDAIKSSLPAVIPTVCVQTSLEIQEMFEFI